MKRLIKNMLMLRRKRDEESIKAVCCILAAVILVGGGYVAGQRAKQSSIVSALPKNILDMPKESNEPSESAEPESKPSEDVPEPKEDVRIINKSNESAVDSTWSTVESSSNTTDNGALTLYTSAQKDGDEFIWDDSQKWVLEVSDGNGGYYTLFDQNVSNGSVYYDVAETDNGTKNINVYVFTGAGTTIKQYTHTETGFSEKSVYESGAVNRVFTTIPSYK